METALIVAGVVVALIVAVVVLAAMRPPQFRVERSSTIEAPADVVFRLINDFHNWLRWSPWDHLDPDLKRTYEGSPAGPGAVYTWNGNSKVGEGRMTILESAGNDYIAVRLDFFRPFRATNQVRYTLTPAGSGTKVSWVMEGRKNFMMKVFGLFFDMDKMIGKDFERGLANLNAAARKDVETKGQVV